MTHSDHTMKFPTAIEELLRRAAADPALAELLLEDRNAAIEASGLVLSDAERAIVQAVSPDELREAIDRTAAGPPRQIPVPPSMLIAPQGIRPDRPEPGEAPAGIRPDRPPPSMRVTGIQPDRPEHLLRPKRPGLFARLFGRKK